MHISETIKLWYRNPGREWRFLPMIRDEYDDQKAREWAKKAFHKGTEIRTNENSEIEVV